MSVKDKNNSEQSREGAGRVAIHKDCGKLKYCYTLECNYAGGRILNRLNEAYDAINNKIIPNTDPLTNYNSIFYSTKNIASEAYFNSHIYWDVGRTCMISLLDMINKNPISRVMNSVYKGEVELIKDDIIKYLISIPDLAII